MSIYSHVETGTPLFRKFLPNFNRKGFTGTFFTLYPTFHRFALPGDIWNVDPKFLVRLQPLLSPNLTEMNLRHRFFFVPIRLVEENTELVITGSNDGKLSEETLPVLPTVFHEIESATFTVLKDSILNIFFGIVPGTYTKATVDALKSSPALYWLKAYCRIWWDYYRDENLNITITCLDNSTVVQPDDFDDFWPLVAKNCHIMPCLPSLLPKDYLTSSLPWLLKGVQPTIDILSDVTFQNIGNADVTFSGIQRTPSNDGSNTVNGTKLNLVNSGKGFELENFMYDYDESEWSSLGRIGTTSAQVKANDLAAALNNTARASSVSLNMQKFREMAQMTRIFERLARAGSRYTEYLRANFGTSPADGTLQRAQYLGGFKQQILTTEVVQTAGAGESPVGTLRGHGISYGGKSLKNVQIKEFGVLIGITDVRPKIQYTQGINREFTYRARFDFFNPSFQHLSEQEVRKGEIYFDGSKDADNVPNDDKTFGFQGIYNELRSGSVMFTGEMGYNGSMSYWNQALQFGSRPELNGAFINGRNHLQAFLRPFGMSDIKENPLIFDCGFDNKPFRPMVKNAVPGENDHL